jgi:hypothetical protein
MNSGHRGKNIRFLEERTSREYGKEGTKQGGVEEHLCSAYPAQDVRC